MTGICFLLSEGAATHTLVDKNQKSKKEENMLNGKKRKLNFKCIVSNKTPNFPPGNICIAPVS